MSFPCSKCGACCTRVGELAPHLPRGEDGACLHLLGRLCLIYDRRPLVCRIDDLFDAGATGFSDRDELYRKTAEACNAFIDEDGLDESLHVVIV